MAEGNPVSVTTSAGTRPVDSAGSPLGVVHLDPAQSYVEVGNLLQAYINNADQDAWEQIKAKIDYTFANLDLALAPLDAATGFGAEVKARVAQGQKVLFKPNLVIVPIIDPHTHAPDRGSVCCTEWAFLAALMRWFHDRLGISYYQMAMGEAGTMVPVTASFYSMSAGRRITPEAVMEGKCGDLYAGWAFYFVRQYLSERRPAGGTDDPMQGYEESLAGTYLAPGLVSDKLMVYDLNRVNDDENKGRDVPVPDGENYQSITLHKVLVGGDPGDPADRQAYPGCILVNVPRLKVHDMALYTNAIKNLGIGLYPMQAPRGGSQQWQYAWPHGALACVKAGIPHWRWIPDLDPNTGLPRRDATGKVIARKTGGLLATMVDVIKAVSNQGSYLLHVVEAIEAVNLDHVGSGQREPEGLVVAGLDPVAIDLLCARYLFGNVPLAEAEQAGLQDGSGSYLAQKVPVPVVEGGNIVTRSGYDCPLARDVSFAYYERRGLGQRAYHVLGRDSVRNRPLVSVRGYLGTVADGAFTDLTTPVLYFHFKKVPWDLQLTFLQYLEAVDQLTGSTLKGQFLAAFDEDGDGVASYEEFGGPRGPVAVSMYFSSVASALRGTQALGQLRGPLLAGTSLLRYTKAAWNPDAVAVFEELNYGTICLLAYRMSQREVEAADPFLPSLTWGKGKWPSFEYAAHLQFGAAIYGPDFPTQVALGSLYGLAFRYADVTQNEGGYAGTLAGPPDPQAIDCYLAEMASGKGKRLDFVLYVPSGYGTVGGARVPNVEETDDPFRILTAHFVGGAEVWPPSQPGDLLRAGAVPRV